MSNLHPSMFETPNVDVKSERALALIQEERAHRLPESLSFVSPGRYNLTPDDASVAPNNTRTLLTNIYANSLLTQMFFSDKNIANLQRVIQLLVFKETSRTVDMQSTKELMIIMRGIFLEYSQHPEIVHSGMSQIVKEKLYAQYTGEVSRLNELVLNYTVPKVVSNLQAYLDYLRDASRQPYQMDSPKNDSVSGERQYRSLTQVWFGGDL